MFEPVNSKQNFLQLEKQMLSWWDKNDIPRKYREKNETSAKRWSFIDGPITANNPMGVHHAWGRSYKDLFLRFRNMQGYRQRFQNGFDGQGLWIEVEVEKELGFKSKLDIEEYGVGEFVDLCKQRVDRFAAIISEQSKRLAQWMDWDNSYHTKSDENNYTIWYFLKTCMEKGLLYEGTDVMPWCPRCSAGLSEHEIVTEGYREIVHPGLFVKFPLLHHDNESLLVWTTTPWTLTSNVAAAVHPKITYVKVLVEGDILYVAKNRLTVLQHDYKIIADMVGSDLVGLQYSGPFDELPAQLNVKHRVVAWDEVSEDEGTGIVHTAPGAGKEDYALGRDLKLSIIAPLDEFGMFMDGFGPFTGKSVFNVNEEIYTSLRAKGIFYYLERYTHRYPVCWRCGTELVFRLVDEWFIKMDPIRRSLKEITQSIQWVPEFGMRRELDWLNNMDDWMISKKRYYGLALPIYKCYNCGNFDVIGSEIELKERSVEGWEIFDGHSPHRPWVDAVKIHCSDCRQPISRIREVGNPWLDAGIVPFSTLGYRHNNQAWNDWFPANWISESFPGQFRNWFYSMLTMGAVLEDSASFLSVFSYALMRDENGDEMHKSSGNSILFEDAAEIMGVDSMRWVFARHDPAANINFGYSSADEVRRQFIIPLWNVYSFFITYANIDQFDPTTPTPPISNRTEMDRWILSDLNLLVSDVTSAFEQFEPQIAARKVETFVGSLSNWYVRRNRRRFWQSGRLDQTNDGGNHDKLAAYATLYEVLVTLSKLLAPVMPFITDAIYQNLTSQPGIGYESVHLEHYPVVNTNLIENELTEAMQLAMRISSLGRAARSKASIKVRQPLSTAMVRTRTEAERSLLRHAQPQIIDELNVKQITLFETDDEVMDIELQANMPILGPKYGMELHNIIEALAKADVHMIARKVSSDESVDVEGYILEPEEILVSYKEKQGFSVSADSGYTVAIETKVTSALQLEGLARELVHRIQNMRRSADFDITDHIITYYQGHSNLREVVDAHAEYIRQETLTDELLDCPAPSNSYIEEQTFDNISTIIGLVRKTST